MSRRRAEGRLGMGAVMSLLLALGACQAKAPTGPDKSARPGQPVASTAHPSGGATATPQPGPPRYLVEPQTPHTRVAGRIAIDATYAVATGAGRVISHNGASVLATGGGELLSESGSGVIANNGSNLVGDAATLISDNGLGLISDNGLGIISNNGGALGAEASLAWRLLMDDAPAFDKPPTAGMLVGAVSLVDGQALPVGVDADGHPVYAVYSNAAGEYTLYLPAELKENVRVVARVPGSTDPRLDYDVLTEPGERLDQRLSEGPSLAVAYLRISLVGRMDELLSQDTSDSHDVPPGMVEKLPAAIRDAAVPVLREIQQALIAGHVSNLPPAHRRAVLQRLADAVTAYVDAPALMSDAAFPGVEGPPVPALASMATFLDLMEQRAAAIIARDPGFFARQPYLIELNRARAAAGLPLAAIRRPSDVGALVVGQYMSANVLAQQRKAFAVFEDLGITEQERIRFKAAVSGIYQAVAFVLIANEDALAAGTAAIAAASRPEAAPGPYPLPVVTDVPVPSPAPAAEPEGQVSTVAGTGNAGLFDGPGASAQFSAPRGIVRDPDASPLTFYLADGHTLRTLMVGADGKSTVSTLAGLAREGTADGPLGTNAWRSPQSLAIKGRTLYVGDLAANTIRAVDLADPTHTVTTIAGDGTNGFLDGPGKRARFNWPEGLAIAPDGSLWISDGLNRRIRRIDLADPAHAVTTVAGNENDQYLEGPFATARFAEPAGLVTGPDGTVYLADAAAHRIRRLDPDGRTRLLAGGWYGLLTDGYWANAAFDAPLGVALDAHGNLIVGDTLNNRLRLVTPGGDVSTLAGAGPLGLQDGGFADGPAHSARFGAPRWVALDPAGDVYISDQAARRVRKLTRAR